jgi:hypothetical protein
MDREKVEPAYLGLLALSLVFAIGAVLTLVPAPGASWPNIMGYKSLCTFAPGATLACALLAGITCTLRARLVKRTKTRIAGPIIVLAILAAAFAAATALWSAEKARYTDAVTSASIEEQGR